MALSCVDIRCLWNNLPVDVISASSVYYAVFKLNFVTANDNLWLKLCLWEPNFVVYYNNNADDDDDGDSGPFQGLSLLRGPPSFVQCLQHWVYTFVNLSESAKGWPCAQLTAICFCCLCPATVDVTHPGPVLNSTRPSSSSRFSCSQRCAGKMSNN